MSKEKMIGLGTAKLPTTVCNFCECEMDGMYPKHKDWCEKVARKVYDRFNPAFREIYNIIELSLDKAKAEIAKDLIGNKIMETRNDCTKLVANYFMKDSKL